MTRISLLAVLIAGVLGPRLLAAEGTDEPHLCEAIPYEIAGPEDANSVFALQLSDEMLYHLFK